MMPKSEEHGDYHDNTSSNFIGHLHLLLTLLKSISIFHNGLLSSKKLRVIKKKKSSFEQRRMGIVVARL